MRKGFTLLETIFALAVFGLVIGTAMGSWILFMHKSHRVNTQALLDMDARRVVERFRAEMRNTARETIIFYPRGAVPYEAVGFALPSDQDNDGLMDMDGSNLLWRQSIVYHVWNRSPYQMRRTLFSNRNAAATPTERYEQIAAVVGASPAGKHQPGERQEQRQHGGEAEGCCDEQQSEAAHHAWARKKTTKPMRARASTKAMPRNMVVRTMPAASGWRAIAWTDWPTR